MRLIDNDALKPKYTGKVYLLDVETGQVITEGGGFFDTATRRLHITYEYGTAKAARHEYLAVLKTTDGYFAPAYTPSDVFLGFGEGSISSKDLRMDSCLWWGLGGDVNAPLKAYKDIAIRIKGIHSFGIRNEGVDAFAVSHQLSSKQLDKAHFKGVSVDVAARYQLSPTLGSFSTSFVYTVTNRGKKFTFRDWLWVVKSFKLYWMLHNDLTDCRLLSLQLGDKISLLTREDTLRAWQKNVAGYREAPHIKTDFNPSLLARTIHFFAPERTKPQGSSSKIGLAFARTMSYRFHNTNRVLENDALSLIFALQSFAEDVGEQEVKTRNTANKREVKEGIKRVLDAVRSIESELPQSVSRFYLKPVDDVYPLVSRPSFLESIDICMAKFGITDPVRYNPLLKQVDKVRRQVVHSQDYDVDFLIMTLLTQGVTDIKTGEGGRQAVTFGQRTGALDELYGLLRLLFGRYFDSYLAEG